MCAEHNADLHFWRTCQQRTGRYNTLRAAKEDQIIQEALRCAAEAASYLKAMLPLPPDERSLDLAMSRFGLKLREYSTGGSPLFGEYDHDQRSIIVYAATISKFSSAFFQGQYDLRKACIVHEFFHALEDITLGDTRQNIRCRLGFWSTVGSKTISDASEIAAHTFTRDVLFLPDIPLNILQNNL